MAVLEPIDFNRKPSEVIKDISIRYYEAIRGPYEPGTAMPEWDAIAAILEYLDWQHEQSNKS